MIELDFFQTNDEISKILSDGKPASIMRIDNTMGYVFDSYNKGVEPVDGFFNHNTFIEGGVYPIDKLWYQKNVIPPVEASMQNSDILGFVDMSGDIRKGTYLNKFDENKKVFGGDSFLIMDPGAILGHSTQYGKLDNPWTSNLKDKKVLVVSTHAESIKHQWNNIDKIWGDSRKDIAPFELVDCIRSPYHPMMDSRQPPNCKDWLQSVEYIKEHIDNYDYDVLLAGCTVSSPLYAEHAKKNGKIGIQTGGTIQLFFGLLGYRWTKVPGYSTWHNMYNEHWIEPLKEDHSQGRTKLQHLEANFAYW